MAIVYAISFICSDKVYVGSTVKKPGRRLAVHLTRLRRGDHHSIGLQRAADKHGITNLCFSILEKVNQDGDVIAAEQRWIDTYKGRHLNASLTAASRLGMTMPEQAKRAISQSLIGNSYRRGIPHSEEVKAKIAASLKRSFQEGRRRASFDPTTLASNNAAAIAEGKSRASKWLEMWNAGMNSVQIGAATGFDESTVRRALKRYFNVSRRGNK